jgi:hypothetical protein
VEADGLISCSAKELTVLAATQRKKGQHEEALASALAATKANPDSANGWWQVALSGLALYDRRRTLLNLTAQIIGALKRLD